MKRFLVFARDPGGANVVAPVVSALEQRGHTVELWAKDVALIRLRQQGLTCQDASTLAPVLSPASVFEFLARLRPDAVLTGTSADDFFEKWLWAAARQLKIPSFAIVDQWINYGVRFSPYSVHELARYETERTHPYLPDRIGVVDEDARNEAIVEGLPEEHLVAVGSPHLQSVIEQGRKLRESKLSTHGKVFVFASEPISTTYRETDQGPHHWGYTERTIFREVLPALVNWSLHESGDHRLLIRPHPKEPAGNFADILAGSDLGNLKVAEDRVTPSLELAAASDLVIGMSSMFLIESYLIGCPVLSVQIGLRRKNPFILSRSLKIPTVLHSRDVVPQAIEAITHGDISAQYVISLGNAVEKVIGEMERLCE